ncbi:MAG: hypothetical protein WC518_04080 [Patescibacteria group bacterium]
MQLPLNIFRFFDPERLFYLKAGIALSTVYFLLALFGVLVLAGLVVEVIRKLKPRENFINKLFKLYSTWLLTLGLLGAALVWFRYERVFILAARFWLLLWLIVLVIWLVFIWRYQFKVVPQARKQSEFRKIFNKYLPRKK